jgi:polysaccharide export outer membrane protein
MNKIPVSIQWLLAVFMLAFITSCTPQRKLVYMQGDASILKDTTSFTMKLEAGDIISVELYTVNPEAFPGFGVTGDRSVIVDNRSAYEKGFILDRAGNVTLPYAGPMHLEGLTIPQAHDTIVEHFRQYIDDPVVVIKKLSFKISIVGEVSHPGLFYVPNEQLSLIEALALAGDLTNYADRTKIKIIRKKGSASEELMVDVTSKTAFTGVTRYIYPDDIIYVPPTRKKAYTTISPATSIITSIVSTLVIIAALYIRNNKL